MTVSGEIFDGAFNDVSFHWLTGYAYDGESVSVDVHFASARLSSVGRCVDAADFHAEAVNCAAVNFGDDLV